MTGALLLPVGLAAAAVICGGIVCVGCVHDGGFLTRDPSVLRRVRPLGWRTVWMHILYLLLSIAVLPAYALVEPELGIPMAMACERWGRIVLVGLAVFAAVQIVLLYRRAVHAMHAEMDRRLQCHTR